MSDDAKARAARYWFGYGRWAAPYWFVGMEPGGTDDHASYETWLTLDVEADGLIDCRAHHEASNAAAGKPVTHWHRPDNPPTQPTWRRLIQLLLAYEGRPTDLDAVRQYQRDSWGSDRGETAVLELSAMHAPSIESVSEGREAYRDERVALLAERLIQHNPQFVVLYGRGYKLEYERIAGGQFASDGTRWNGETLCVFVRHPVGPNAPNAIFWEELGRRMRAMVDAGPGAPPRKPPYRRTRPGSRQTTPCNLRKSQQISTSR